MIGDVCTVLNLVGTLDDAPGSDTGWERFRRYLKDPILIDAGMRAQLDAFSDNDPNKPWSWFVFATRALTEHDYKLLTGDFTAR